MPVLPDELRRSAHQLVYPALMGLLVLGGCASRRLAEPPLGQDAPYEGEDADTREAVRIVADVQRQRAAEQNKGNASTAALRRGAHAKGHGCVKGTLEPLDPQKTGAATPGKQVAAGVFDGFAKYDVYGRFSNASAALKNDSDSEPRGFAFKLLGVPGAKLWSGDGQAKDMDLVLVNVPVFPAASVADYNSFITSRTWYALTHLPTVIRALRSVPGDVTTLLGQTYFSSGAIKWGETAAKLRLAPCKSPVASALSEQDRKQQDNNFLAAELERHLSRESACFVLAAQLQKDPSRQSVEDVTTVWDEEETPYVPFVRLTLPQQDVESSSTLAGRCETTVFHPWRTVAGHRPLGALNRARRAVYEESASNRQGKK